MRNKILAALLAATFVALPTASFATGWQFGVQGGGAIPTGDFADIDAETGYIFGVLADYLFDETWAFGANFSMAGNNHADVGVTQNIPGGGTYTLDEDKYTTTQIGVHAKYMFPSGGKIKPFGILGVGLTQFKEEYTETYTFPSAPDDTQTYEFKADQKFGGRLGGGATWWLNEMWGLGGEADYNYVSQEGGSLTYIALRAGATVKILGAK